MNDQRRSDVQSDTQSTPNEEETSEKIVKWTYKSATRQFCYERFKSKFKLGKFQVAIILLLDGLDRELTRTEFAIAFGDRLKFETEKAKIKSIVSTLKRMCDLGFIDGYMDTERQYSPMVFKANALTNELAVVIRRDVSNRLLSAFGMGAMDVSNPGQIIEDARKNLGE